MVRKEDYEVPVWVIDKKLWMESKLIADETYKKPSAYKSMYIAKKYKQLGGKYDESKRGKKKKEQTKEWLKEEWIQVKPFVESKKKIKCGKGGGNKVCRPSKTVEGAEFKDMTIQQILDKWGKKKVMELTNKKLNDMDGRLNWKDGTFKSSEDRDKEAETRKKKSK